jgi:BirA family biotin operon repressor/biotin-[acetyl-CoA-carboxylase] ligase
LTAEQKRLYPGEGGSLDTTLAQLQQHLTTTTFGRSPESRWLGSVDSTNRVAREAAGAGAPEGTLIAAEEQVAGRGRLGRRWQAPTGSSLLVSLVLRPPAGVQHALLPFVAAVALAEAVEAELGLSLNFKWPNDLLLAGAKCGGILAEGEWIGNQLAFVVVGVGLNVNTSAADLAQLDLPATSLALALDRPIDRIALLSAWLARWEHGTQAFYAGHSPLPAWRGRTPLLGQEVMIYPATGQAWSALALDIQDDGALRVRTPDGSEQTVHAADVSVRPTSLPEGHMRS